MELHAVRVKPVSVTVMGSTPEHWLFTAGLDSVAQFRETSRPSLAAWTTPPSSKRGDLAVIYGRAPVKAFVAVARQSTEPVQSKALPDQWFAWLQVQPLRRDIPLTTARSRRGLADWGVLTNLQGKPKRIPQDRRAALYKLLAGGNQRIKTRIATWEDGHGRYPSATLVPLGELARASWEAPETDGLADDHEQWLSSDIAERLVRSNRGRWFKDSDGLAGQELEHFLRLEDGTRGFADIVLVSKEHTRPTLLVVEVKWRAEPVPPRNPVPQVLRYRDALRRKWPRWRVKSMVIATEYSPAVLQLARSTRVEALRYSSEHDRLRKA